jgi:hypothetical protein
MVSFEIFVKAMPPSLSELKVLPSFCFAFKIPDDVAASIAHVNCQQIVSKDVRTIMIPPRIFNIFLNFFLWFPPYETMKMKRAK